MADLSEVKNAKGLVIFLSGLTGDRDLPLFKKASVYFVKNNFSTLKINICTTSTLKDMTFSVYAERLRDVCVHFDKKYPKIILVGHSFGAIIALMFFSLYKKYSKSASIILWDPSLLPWKKKWMEEDFSFNKKTKLYQGKHARETINAVFYNECIKTNSVNIFRSLCPTSLVIAAENSADKDAKKYSSKATLIKKTDHYFSGTKAQKQLFEASVNFLKERV